jgi:DNA-binding GntR family transcriptional regulator
MSRTADTSSRTTFVFEELRSDLLDGRIMPGTRLKLPALAERFNLSMTVIREALTRLAEQGLVVVTPKRGFSVMELSVDDLEDLTYVRVELETFALRASIEQGSLEWETQVVGALHALNRTEQLHPDGTFNVEWFGCHRAFHHALLAGSGSPRLLSLTTTERDRAELYRAWARSLAHDEQRDVRGEHQNLADLALARDTEGAVKALAEHIRRTTRVLIDYAQAESTFR